jgi:hypothetical protein
VDGVRRSGWDNTMFVILDLISALFLYGIAKANIGRNGAIKSHVTPLAIALM